MYHLYYAPATCSLAVHALLHEIAAPFDTTRITLAEPRPESFLKVNPRGSVPVLTHGELVVREGGAILTYLADAHQSPLLPRDGAARAKALEWLMFANATLHPTYSRSFFLARQLGADEAGNHPLYVATIEAIQKYWNEIEAELASRDYIASDQPTLADILLTVIGGWNGWLLQPIQFGPKTQALFARIQARPAFAKAVATETAAQKAAA